MTIPRQIPIIGRRVAARLSVILAVALILIATGPARADVTFAEHQIIVKVISVEDLETIHLVYGTEVIAEIEGELTFLLRLPESVPEEVIEGVLNDDPLTEWAELNRPVFTMDGTTGSFFVNGLDQDFWGQYGPPRMRFVRGDAERPVRVAVLDTGVDATHSVLAGRISSDGYDFVDNDEDPSDTGNGLDEDGDGDVDELVGHGTFITGIIVLVSDAAEFVPMRVLNGEGFGFIFQAALALHTAIDRDVMVANLSFSTPEDARVLAEAVERAEEAGVVVVAATGNEGVDEPRFPAAHPTTVAVAATDADDVKTDFSNYGTYVTVSAPGEAIYGPLPGESYGAADGTSASTAWVTGTTAMLLERSADLEPAEAIAAVIESAADLDMRNPKYAGLLGAGRVDIRAALDLLGLIVTGDVNGDGVVDWSDLLILLSHWGPNPGHPADIDQNGFVDAGDIVLLLGNWS